MPFYNSATGLGQPTIALVTACVVFVYHSRGGDTSAANGAAAHIGARCGQIVAVSESRGSARPFRRIRTVPFGHESVSIPMSVVTGYPIRLDAGF